MIFLFDVLGASSTYIFLLTDDSPIRLKTILKRRFYDETWSMQEDDKKPFSRNVQGHKKFKSKKKGRKPRRKPKPQASIQTNNDVFLQQIINDDNYVVPESVLQASSLFCPDLSSIVVNSIPMQEVTPFPAQTHKESRARQKKHTEIEYAFKCSECIRSFPRKENLNRHINAVHHKTEWWECITCHERTSRKDNMNSHIKRMHKDANPDKDFKAVNIEEEEMKALEEQDEPFSNIYF